MIKLAGAIVVAVVLAAPAAAKVPTPPRTVFGIVWQSRQTSLVELNALTLRPVSKSVPLGNGARYVGRVFGGGGRGAFVVGDRSNGILFVDLEKMKREGTVALPCRLGGAIVWDMADRLVATCEGSAASVLVVDPIKRKLRSRTPLRGSLVKVQAARGKLVGLLTPLDGIGETHVVVVANNGRARTLALPGIRAGTEMLDATKSQMRTELPALAVEPNGRRAVVVPASGPLVDVDLNRLTAFSHTLLTRTPAAIRKTSEGSDRDAVWTYWNTIAVSGSDWTGEGHAWRPAPTTLVDAVNWTTRPLRATASVSTNGYSLVGWGSTWDGVTRRFVGTGLTGYDGNGAERFHLFGEDPVSLATVAGTYAYVASGDLTRFQIVDTESGKILTTLRTSRPTTLAPSRAGL